MDRVIYGFIPARGGSKGVHKKNIQTVSGIPLIARSIIALKSSSHISKIFVSTDCPEIERVAESFGAVVIKRPNELAEDSTSTDPVIEHFVDLLIARNDIPSQIALIQATFPFLNNKIIDQVCGLDDKHDCAFAATEFHGFLWKRQYVRFREQ